MASKKVATPRSSSSYMWLDPHVEKLLAKRAREGDMTAFETLVCSHERGLFGFLRLRTRSDDVAEDLVQEAFLKAYRGIERFDEERSRFKTWLYTIALNLWKDYLKHLARRPRTVAVDLELPSNDQGIAAVESTHRFNDLVGRLDPETAELVTLRFAAGLGYGEIHNVTGLGESTIRSKVHRALKKLRERVLGYED